MAPRPSMQAIRKLQSSATLFCAGATSFDLARCLLQLYISLLLLPVDTAVVLGVAVLAFLPLPDDQLRHQRRLLLQDAHFYPKTILITGVGTVHGLVLARQFHYAGHRVVGADVGLPPIRSGGSMSIALSAFYRISKTQYVSNLIDIINREKVDIWIPCSDRASAMEDGVAKETIESRTSCKCIHFDADFATCFSQTSLFLQYASDKGLPVTERHDVRSRDSIHKILNRSPDKVFQIRKLGSPLKGKPKDAIILPKRTLSQTYSDVSELMVSKEHPWVLKQRGRVGKYWADLLLIQGRVKALKVRPFRRELSCVSRLDEGLYAAMEQLMERFAEKGGVRLTGHLSVKLMVDEEITPHSVRYATYIAGCRQGTTAVGGLLDNPPPDLYQQYLDVLTPEINGVDEKPSGKSPASAGPLAVQPRLPWLPDAIDYTLKGLQRLRHTSKPVDILAEQLEQFVVGEHARFSRLDPLPWWWHRHISRPLNDLVLLLNGNVEAHVKRFP
ncbi:hypothetical protein VTN77DRAFT_9396 [Rasamsonia byssochlamydoides]|uniref:uncharacterized protein n=1 Tax=Rasamsonia byssochlamydoides TaxID=89139 RepID=UPI003743BD1B